MGNSTNHVLLFFILIFLASCKDDSYYERPSSLEPPIYQQLKAKGNFTNYLACVDKAGFTKALSGAGYFTVFAPNDEAFKAFFLENNYAGLDALDTFALRQIATYSIVYNSFTRDRLSDFQSATGWVPLNAFKRRTAYFRGVHNEVVNNAEYKVASANRNGFFGSFLEGGYITGDNNNKYIPYFINSYFDAHSLTAFDYNYFYPNVAFSGFNVADARVINENLYAENGIIHEVDKVTLALPSIEEYILDKPEYSEFKKLLQMRDTLVINQALTRNYRAANSSSDNVYVKYYTNTLAYSPNNEHYLRASDNDGQSDGWSIIVPTNEVLTNYINTVLIAKYKSLDKLPASVIDDFLNSHLWYTTLWPSKFAKVGNVLGELATVDAGTNITDAKMMSNGMFYGSNKVHESNLFHSVFGKAYLDPKYSLMTTFLQRELKSTLINKFSKFVIFLISNDALNAAGYSRNPSTLEWRYDPPQTGTASTGSSVVDRLNRLMNLHIVRIGSTGDQLTDLSGSGIVETLGGEYVKYSGNKLYSAGSLETLSPTVPPVIGAEASAPKANTSAMGEANNGLAYDADKVLKFPEAVIGRYIAFQGDAPSKPYYEFYQYLFNNVALFNKTTFEISGVALGAFHTVLIPTNAAMAKARADGKLPASFNPTLDADKLKVTNFILYHFMVKSVIVPNGDLNTPGSTETLFIGADGLPKKLGVTNQVNDMQILDGAYTRNPYNASTNPTGVNPAKVIVNDVSKPSNQLTQRGVIHQVDRALEY